MKRLFVCCDGTWNPAAHVKDAAAVPTNVSRFRNALAPTDAAGNEQLVYYHPGVGVGVDVVDRVIGGATVSGLARNILSAYKWLSDNYACGDRIHLIGFSRGAFTVRCVSRLIECCGLPVGLSWSPVETAYRIYRMTPDHAETKVRQAAFRAQHPTDPDLAVEFIGVWDTVGPFGIPKDRDWIRNGSHRYRFHDTALPPLVRHARHALAIDETRASLAPTLWTGDPAPGQTVRQAWFPGVHGDVGGGYKECGLSNNALAWMTDEATNIGVRFRDEMLAQIQPDSQGTLHDPPTSPYDVADSQPRSFPCLAPDAAGPCGQFVHGSAVDRCRIPPIGQAPYRPTRLLDVGEAISVSIYARDFWNWTGLYLPKGSEFEFEAGGEWQNARQIVGPAGRATNPLEWLAAATLRVRDAPWCCLIGAISDGSKPNGSGNPGQMTLFAIGDGCTHVVKNGGYLYGFANDAISPLGSREVFYRNNRGSVRLKVTRRA